MPFLKQVKFNWSKLKEEQKNEFPFNLPALQGLEDLELSSDVTFFIGENGSGKSTLLEAIGELCGFSLVGGKDLTIKKEKDNVSLTEILRLSWFPKVSDGFYFRAETFDSFAGYIDELAEDPSVGRRAYAPYGGVSLNERSHGQAFLSFFHGRFNRKGIYLLDEPESALSPQNQLAFLRIIWDLQRRGHAQFIIATHSPILMSFPEAEIFQFTDHSIERIPYEETDHYSLTKDFLNHRDRYFRLLFADE